MNEVMTIQNRIYEIRGQRVMLDRDLAELYGVETKQLVRQVKRNLERFEGEDFMFELTNQEYNTLITSLRCQNGTSNRGGTLMEKTDEENIKAVNDLSEDIRNELDNIYDAIAALSIKQPKTVGSSKPIGFKTSTSNNNQ